MNIILLHRDLRVNDNPALFHGTSSDNALVVYVYDKSYWQGNGKSDFQFKFAIISKRILESRLIVSPGYNFTLILMSQIFKLNFPNQCEIVVFF